MRASLLTAACLALILAPLGAAPIPPAPAPAWTLKDVDGKAVSSDQFKGKVVILDFWATWCPPCRAEIPGYVALQKKYGADGLVIIGISKDEEGPRRADAIRRFVASFGINYTIVVSNDDLENALGGIEAIPTTFIIDRSGKIVNKKVGAEPTEQYEKELLGVLKPPA